MKALGNKIYIQQGENFTLKFGAHDVAPLVITHSMAQPFIVITLKSTQHKQENQYVSMRWLDCQHVTKFYKSNIAHLGIGTIDSVTVPSSDDGNEQVYSVSDESGELTYFWWNGEEKLEYDFTFIVNYDHNESGEFVDREYIGEVHLIDGEATAAYLYELCDKYNLTLSDKTMVNAYNALLNIHASELETLDAGLPLREFTLKTLLLKFNLYVEV